jgi:uncharacterized protein (DUF302 family)
MLYEIRTKKNLQEVTTALEAAAQKYKFGVLAVHDLKAKMKEKGVEFERECLIYEVCNPQQAKKVLEAHPEISSALPCRISIYADNGGFALATLRPTALIGVFATPALKAVAQEVEDVILKMMEEAAR